MTQRPDRPAERRRVIRAAFLRPMSLLVLVIGAVFFAMTLIWWALPLTLATYAALVFLAARDPIFRSRILEGREIRPVGRSRLPKGRDVSPERRADRLPHGETRQKVEAALEAHRRALVAIEESDDATRAVLGDVAPKLDRVIERLVDVALMRESVAGEIQDLKTSAAGAKQRDEARGGDLVAELENKLRLADAEVSGASEKLSTLRARVVRVSTESGGAARGATARLNEDLDEVNLRLDALRSRLSPPQPLDR